VKQWNRWIKIIIVATLGIFILIPYLAYGQTGEWLSIEDENFIVYYRSGFKSDAEKILMFANWGRNVTMRLYPHKLNNKTKIYLYDKESYGRSIYSTWADVGKNEIHMVLPSDNPAYGEGKYVDDFWYLYAVTHEYTHIVTRQDAGYNLPHWLSEGIATYIPDFHVAAEYYNDLSMLKTGAPKHSWYLNPVRDLVKKGSGYLLIVSGVEYGGGAYIVKYMYETYGSQKVVSFFKTLSTLNFVEALKSSFNVSYLEFEENWLNWAIEEFNADKTLYPPSSAPLLRKSYTELEAAYSRLKADYENLKAEYNKLKADFNKLIDELNTFKSLTYISLLIVVILIMMSVYLIHKKKTSTSIITPNSRNLET